MKFLLLFALFFNCVVPANAMSFTERVPSYGLYCSDAADIYGKVTYTVDGEGNAVKYSEYEIGESKDDLNFFLPFVSSAFNLPEIEITVNGKPAVTQTRYGGGYRWSDATQYYPRELDEAITGTLYSITPDSERFTVSFDSGGHNYIFLYPLSYTGKRGEKTFLEFDQAVPGCVYEIYVLYAVRVFVSAWLCLYAPASAVKKDCRMTRKIHKVIRIVNRLYNSDYL